MKSLDYTLSTLPGQPIDIPYDVLPLNSPVNILTDQKAELTTNPYVKPAILTTTEITTSTTSTTSTIDKPRNIPFAEINEKLSINFMGFINDLFNKPDDESWSNYLAMILSKDDRYTYFGILIFFITLFILFMR
jgi:hypothetical protein